jgi:transcription initiation factor TFIIIB Brf1 subunit/transcription initiation factor TFIIB
LATDPPSQRAYRAACPNCGAPVEFRSPASAFAVCSFCRSTIVRDGDALRKIGESAELFDDHSPLQLGASGRFQGAPFTLVGRLQYRYADGTWNEWHALFDTGDGPPKSGWLSEDNGRYVFAFDLPAASPAGAPTTGGDALPAPERLTPGAQLSVGGQAWKVASVTTARVLAAQGELPVRPVLDRAFPIADLRNPRGEVGTLEYSEPSAPRWSIGRSVALSELAMTGLAEAAEKTLKGRSIECPNCGTSLPIQLTTTQSIVCPQCKSVIDLSKGIGGALEHYAQDNGSEPQIPLGSVGTLAFGSRPALPWQVVGYVERCTVPGGSEDDDDSQEFWREYLLYHRTEGFAFLVDAQDGWSWTAPITGVPEAVGNGVRHEGVLYRKLYDYTGKVTYVLGEFYWQVARHQLTHNSDYQGTGAAAQKRLNRERTDSGESREIVWSAGETLTADAVLKAFRLAPAKAAALQRDALPTFSGASLLAKIFFWAFLVIVVLMLFRCGSGGGAADCEGLRNSYGEASQEYRSCLDRNRSSGGFRTGGGSFGGFSTGGGHK